MKKSAGFLLYKISSSEISIFLVHPGGPFFSKKDYGAWSIPKGEIGKDESPLDTAIREVNEEIGVDIDISKIIDLGEIKQKGGKIVYAWGYEIKYKPMINSENTFEMEWPPKSGKIVKFPEIDKAQFFNIEDAKVKINPAQCEFILRLEKLVSHTKIQLSFLK